MITADDLACRVSSEAAIKINELSCKLSTPTNSGAPQSWVDWVGALANIGLLVVAIIAGRLAYKQLTQMKKDSFDRSRPYVAAQVIPSISGGASYDLLVHNLGASRAHGMTLKVIEPKKIAYEDEFTEAIEKVFSREQSLVPGERIRLYWRLGLQEGNTWLGEVGEAATRALGMPDRTRVQVDYKDENGKKFSDEFILDTTIYVTAPGSDGGTDPDMLGYLSAQEKSLQHRLKEITAAIKELGR